MSRKCPECETESNGDSPFCEHCGFRFGGRVLPTVQEKMIHPESHASLRTTTEEAVRPREKVKTEPEGLGAVDTAAEYAEVIGDAADVADTKRLIWLGLAAIVVVSLVTVFIVRAEPETGTIDLGETEKIQVSAGNYTFGLADDARALFITLCERQKIDDETVCDEATLFDGEYPTEKRNVEAFKIDSREVTGGQYNRCVASGDCSAVDIESCRVYTHAGLQVIRTPSILLEPERSAVCLTWQQANDYCAHVKGQLPTLDQWQKSARGSKDIRTFPWGDHWEPTAANWGERDALQTPVLGKIDGAAWTERPGVKTDDRSPHNVIDLAGNVAEWSREQFALGGSWTSKPTDLRVTKRKKIDPVRGRTNVGFRCVYEQ